MALSTAHDIDAWRRLSSRHFVELECESAATIFTASIDSRSLTASTSVSRVRSGPIPVDRTPHLARTDARDDVLLICSWAGRELCRSSAAPTMLR